jgi:hypothetical protein
MSMSDSKAPFFIGWSGRLPPELVRFYLAVGLFVVAAFAGLGLSLGSGVDDPSRNLFAALPGANVAKPDGWLGDQKFDGVLTLRPYPVLHVSSARGGRVERSMLLSGSGKRGVVTDETAHRVSAEGGLLRRGDIDTLVVDDPPAASATPASAPETQALGHWRSVGEICDGKCYPGGMTPGFGLAHRACAAVCLIGDVPAIFVTAQPLAGASFLLLAGPDGAAPGAWIRDFIARPVELEGDVERVGAMLIFKIDPAKARLL